ncbi:aromatic acid exporter family protein [Streptomyces sp. NPDC058470]|uniref:aromatic acid exporter family protein n=1 Tax=Streptomyces sp. NPDC058470 TaxID=3346515 RepID=UPI00364D2A53
MTDTAVTAGAVRRAVTAPGPERDTAVQALKAAGAAFCAWALAGWWWHAPLALLAPWTALVLVHSTVYRSVRSAIQQFAGVALGTFTAAAAAALTHNPTAAMAVTLPLTVLMGTYPRLEDQGWYVPTAAVFVLAYGTPAPVDIVHRLLETVLGAVIGLTVNALILPPDHTRGLVRLRTWIPDQFAQLLRDVADGVEKGYGVKEAEDWYGRALRLLPVVADLHEAQHRSEESRLLNPGRRLRRSPPTPPPGDDVYHWDRVADHVVAMLRSLADTAYENSRFAAPPYSARRDLATLLQSAARACEADERHLIAGDERAPQAESALEEAESASGRLAAGVSAASEGGTASLGELAIIATRLLGELASVTAGHKA